METFIMVDFKALVPWRNNKAQAPATRDDFFDPLVTFRREMDRMFDDFFGGSGLRGPQSGWQALTPAVDVDENDSEIVISAELPGVTEKDIDVSLAGDVLTIKGEKRSQHEEKNGDSTYTERRFGSFSRSVRLPFEAGDEKVDAQFSNGLLKVRVAKPAQLQRATRRIEVRTA
jgi:HSP20 family protein